MYLAMVSKLHAPTERRRK